MPWLAEKPPQWYGLVPVGAQGLNAGRNAVSMSVTGKPAMQTKATAPRTPGHAWAHQCEICGEGAAFGCADRQGVTH